MSKSLEQETKSAARNMAVLWEGLVDGGVPPDHATRIVVGMLTGGRSEKDDGLGELLKMAMPQ